MNAEDTKMKRILIIGGMVFLVLLIFAILYFVFKGSGNTLNDEDGFGRMLERNKASDWQAEKTTEGTPVVKERIVVPEPTEEKREAPLPYVVPESEPAPVTIGYAQGLPPMDTGFMGQNSGVTGESAFTYEQLKALKQELLRLCRENTKLTLDGGALRDSFIKILNMTLNLSITPTDLLGIDVVYNPQVSGVIQSIDSVTCKDKDPSVPKQE